MKKILLLSLSAFMLHGCAGFIYSPSVLAPSHPLQKNEGQVMAGAGLFPKANFPDEGSEEKKTLIGGEGLVRYAFSDDLTLQWKFWNDLSQTDNLRGGIALSGIINLSSRSSEYKFALVPSFGMVYEDNVIEGKGLAVSLLMWIPATETIHPYIAVGPALGTRRWDFESEWGWGLIGNVGTSFDLGRNFQLNAELSGIFQGESYPQSTPDSKTHFILSPQIALGWRF